MINSFCLVFGALLPYFLFGIITTITVYQITYLCEQKEHQEPPQRSTL